MIRYDILPLDLTGANPANLIIDEIHTLVRVGTKNHRLLLPNEGMFYKRGLSVRQTVDGKPLVYGVDYHFGYHAQEFSLLTGLDIETFIVFTNPAVTSEIKISYQALGGDSSLMRNQLKDLLDSIDEDSIVHNFYDIIGMPEGFPGDENHPHEYWQIYAWDSLIENLDFIAAAVENGNKAAILQAARDYMKSQSHKMDDYVEVYRGYMSHLVDFNNPHEVDKNDVGLDKINNWRMATYLESNNKTIDNLYLPISGTISLIEKHLLPTLTAHIENKNNPHQLKLERFGLMTKAEVDDAFRNKLLRTQAAYNSVLFNGNTVTNFYWDVKHNISGDDIALNSVFPRVRLDITTPAVIKDMVLVGDGTYRTVKDLAKDLDWIHLRRKLVPGQHLSITAAWNALVSAGASSPDYTILITHFKRNNGDWDGRRPVGEYSHGEIYEPLIAMKNSNYSSEYVNGLYPLYNYSHVGYPAKA